MISRRILQTKAKTGFVKVNFAYFWCNTIMYCGLWGYERQKIHKSMFLNIAKIREILLCTTTLHIPGEQGSPIWPGSSPFFQKHGNSPYIPLFCSQFPCYFVPHFGGYIPLFFDRFRRIPGTH